MWFIHNELQYTPHHPLLLLCQFWEEGNEPNQISPWLSITNGSDERQETLLKQALGEIIDSLLPSISLPTVCFSQHPLALHWLKATEPLNKRADCFPTFSNLIWASRHTNAASAKLVKKKKKKSRFHDILNIRKPVKRKKNHLKLVKWKMTADILDGHWTSRRKYEKPARFQDVSLVSWC